MHMNCWSSTITRPTTVLPGSPRRRGPLWFATARSPDRGGENVKSDLQPEHRSAAVLTSRAKRVSCQRLPGPPGRHLLGTVVASPLHGKRDIVWKSFHRGWE